MADIFVPPGSGASGTQGGQDPTLVSGQDPASLFGIPISYGSGAGGTPAPGGEQAGSADPAGQPNQYPGKEPISGVALGGTGAPGSTGVMASATDSGGTTVTVTDPNYTAGKPGGGSGVQMVTVSDSVSGPDDWTATQNNYPPQHPVVPGDHYPTSSGAGGGRVLRGGYMKGQR